RVKFFSGSQRDCKFCKACEETTDHFLYDCAILRSLYISIGELLRQHYDFYVPKRDHFLAFYIGRDENFINATITKVHQILYAKRSSNEYDISGVLNMAKIHLHVLKNVLKL
ncbi:Uncharacterized protein FKW44_017069, partial [Caligus rogercresseyi]